MAITVGELVGYIRADDGQFTDALDRSDSRMRQFQATTDGTLRQVEHDFGSRGRAMGEALRSGIDETIAELHPEIPLDADPRPANDAVDRLVRRLEELRAHVDVDVPPERAMRELDAIRAELSLLSERHADPAVRVDSGNALFTLGIVRSTLDDIDRAHPQVRVGVDAGRALAELHDVDRAERNVGDNDGPRRASGLFGMLGGAIRSVVGPLGSVVGQAGMMAGAIGAVVPVAAALIATLVNIAPAAAVGASAVFMLASAFGAIKLGTAGVGGAFKAAFAPAVSGGGGAAKSAGQVASAMRAVKDATQQAAYANQAAARQVSDSERSVTDAQKAARTAQLDLNAAREQATRDLQDLNDQLTDARLSERGAAADVTTALDALNAARAQGTGPGTSMDALQLAYDKAVQKLKEAKEQTARLGEDTKKANKAGVDGQQAMVDARQKVADSNRALSDQERALSDARVQQTRTAAQGQETIQKAVESLNAASASAGGGGGGVNKLAQALAALSPAARAFVLQVIALKGAWTAMQQAVQETLFRGLAASLKDTATSVLPVLRTGLVQSAGALNLMARGAMDAARNVARDGTLGQALASASGSLRNLAGIPGIAIRAIAQLAAAAGPAFQGLTAAVGRAATSIGTKLNDAFKSGRMKSAIDTAVGLIKQIGIIGSNVLHIVGSIFSAASSQGGGFLNTLQRITGALARTFDTPAVQGGLRAMFGLFSQVSKLLAGALGPILQQVGKAFAILAPVITNVLSSLKDVGPIVALVLLRFSPFLALLSLFAPVLGDIAKPIGGLVRALAPLIGVIGKFVGQLGKALVPVVNALAPVLGDFAGLIGSILSAVAPLLPVFGDLIAVALKPLGPVLQVFSGSMKEIAPVIGQLAGGLGKALVPILTGLGQVLDQLVVGQGKQFTSLLRQLVPIIPVLIPVFLEMGKSLGQILLALAPLIPQLLMLGGQVLSELLPALLPLLPPLAQLEILFLRIATGVITKVVIPVLSGLIRFIGSLQRKFAPAIEAVTWLTDHIAKAFEWLYDHLVGHSVIPDLVRGIVSWFAGLPRKAWNALSKLAGNLADRATDAGRSMVRAIKTGLSNALDWITGLPGRAKTALGDLGGVLYDAGKALLRGFVNGISDMGDTVKNAVGNVLSGASNLFPHSPAKEGPFSGKGYTLYSGQAIGLALGAGLLSQRDHVSGAARALMASAHHELGAPGTAGASLVTPPGGGRAGYGSAGWGAGPLNVRVTAVMDVRGADDAMATALRKMVSVRGGDVQVALGRE